MFSGFPSTSTRKSGPGYLWSTDDGWNGYGFDLYSKFKLLGIKPFPIKIINAINVTISKKPKLLSCNFFIFRFDDILESFMIGYIVIREMI